MNAKIYALVPAMMLALGATAALAQTSPRPFAQFDQASLMDHGAGFRPYDQGGAAARDAAYLGGGSDPSYLSDQTRLTTGPGYNIGTGAAQAGNAAASIGDGSDPSYLANQHRLDLEPGYSVGTGAARTGGAW